MNEPVLEMKNISKSFNGVPVLTDVDFCLRHKEIVALMGGNGAGKSTLMKILNGVYQADDGEILLNGEKVHIDSVIDANRHGIGMIFQEFSLVSTLTVAENIFLAHEPKKKSGLVDNALCIEKSKSILSGLGVDIDPTTRVEELSVGYRQIVEIAKALSHNVKILVMDEPTSALTNRETENLFEVVRKLVNMDIAIIFISHRIKEIYQICDRITVLRDGHVVVSDSKDNIPIDTIVNYIVGSESSKRYAWVPREFALDDTPILTVNNMSTEDKKVKDVSFSLHHSEILGIAGLMGSGRSETVLSLFGLEKVVGGSILVNGKPVRIDSPSDAINLGIALVPESRRVQGLVIDHSVQDNILITVLNEIQKIGWINDGQGTLIVEDAINKLRIKTESAKKAVNLLSGGNQQKVVLAKWLATKPAVLLLDEPTIGVDIGAKTEILHEIRYLSDNGCSIVFISSELNELLAVSDRILVLKDGVSIREVNRADLKGEEDLQRAVQGY